MALLADLERLLERVFERSTARLFRAQPQAVQVERRVERAMERARTTHGSRTTVPARYRVRLHPDDLTVLAAQSDGAEDLAARLADAALAFARSHAYHLPGRPSVALVADPAVERGAIEVDAVATPTRTAPAPAAAPGRPGAGDRPADRPRPPDGPALGPRPSPAASTAQAGVPEAREADPPRPAPPDPAVTGGTPQAADIVALDPLSDDPDAGIRGDGTRTMVFRRPAPVPTRAVLRVVARDGTERTIEVDGTPLTLGRATDNALVIADPRVSRHHARLQARRGTLVFTDLGSTNGSRVNGIRVDECALGTGDRVLLGDTVLLVEQLPG